MDFARRLLAAVILALSTMEPFLLAVVVICKFVLTCPSLLKPQARRSQGHRRPLHRRERHGLPKLFAWRRPGRRKEGGHGERASHLGLGEGLRDRVQGRSKDLILDEVPTRPAQGSDPGGP